jgi:DDE superfamily endonuclease
MWRRIRRVQEGAPGNGPVTTSVLRLGSASPVLCSDGPATSLVELTLTAEHRRGHGAMYDAVNPGWLEPRRLRRLLASTPLSRAADGRIVLAVDVSDWLRPDVPTTPTCGSKSCSTYTAS